MRRAGIFGSVFALLAVGAWLMLLAVRLSILPNVQIIGSFQADLVAALFLASLGLSALLVVYAGLALWIRRLMRKSALQQQTIDQMAHRRFISRLDHEMKNPLAIIRLGLLNLRAEEERLSIQSDSITRVEQQFQRLQKLLEDLRYLTELEHYPLEKSAVNLQEVLEEAVALTCPDERQIELKVQQVPWTLSPVWGDADLLLVAFRNLLDNALKFTAPDDQIEVRASEDGSSAVIEVADTGVGIAADEMENVFEELYRGKNAGAIAGSGLGLPMVQRIVELHGGSIELSSRLAQGTLLRVRLPLASENKA
jgi:two-component system, OmpR family, sensor kinase